jgi:hypothetical protein
MRIPLHTIDDLQQFVDEYQPTVEVVAQIIARKLRVFPDVDAYPNASALMDDLRAFLARYSGQELPMFIP